MSIKAIEHASNVSGELKVLLLVLTNGYMRGAGQSKLLVKGEAVNMNTDTIRYQPPAVPGTRKVPTEGLTDVSFFQGLLSNR